MKKSFLVLVLLGAIMLCGCLPEWFPGVTPGEPEVPVLIMEANVDAVLVVEDELYQVAWSIENVGDLFIGEYIITFDVLYPDAQPTKDNVIFTAVGKYLEIGDKREGIFDLLSYDSPETVSVSWELFE